MDAPVSGDIFPAIQAIRMIDEIDLTPPIEIPPIPPEVNPETVPEEEHRQLHVEILRLKKERNAYILAHNYAPKDIQDIADTVGDSLYLAQRGAASDADVLLEASVLFMNQILAIMKKPHQRVLAPDLGALCSLAAHADVEKIRAWKRDHPSGIVISYVNTYLDVKAESDYCCASANAAKVILHVLANSEPHQPILFLPDVYLGFYAAKLLEEQHQSLDRLWLMMGACHVHDSIRPYHVERQRQLYPDAARRGASRVRLHQLLYAADGPGHGPRAYDAVSLHSRHGRVRARHAAKSRYHGHRGRQHSSVIQGSARKDHRAGQSGSGLRLHETKYFSQTLSFPARRGS
jgi:Quinolinate synthetase A protein